MLEGSIRRPGRQVRVSSQLIDAATDAHLWAERFDCDTGDLFALQSEITSRLARTLSLELVRAEATAGPCSYSRRLDSGTDSSQTLSWREIDSNSRSCVRWVRFRAYASSPFSKSQWPPM